MASSPNIVTIPDTPIMSNEYIRDNLQANLILALNFDNYPFVDHSLTPATLTNNGVSRNTTTKVFGAGSIQTETYGGNLASNRNILNYAGDSITIEGWVSTNFAPYSGRIIGAVAADAPSGSIYYWYLADGTPVSAWWVDFTATYYSSVGDVSGFTIGLHNNHGIGPDIGTSFFEGVSTISPPLDYDTPGDYIFFSFTAIKNGEAPGVHKYIFHSGEADQQTDVKVETSSIWLFQSEPVYGYVYNPAIGDSELKLLTFGVYPQLDRKIDDLLVWDRSVRTEAPFIPPSTSMVP